VQLIWRWLGQKPSLEKLERQPLAPGVTRGPSPTDRWAVNSRVVAHEAPGPPEPGGPYERLAYALRGYDVFPPRLLTGVVRRRPVQVGDTFGTCFHFLPGLDIFFGGRVTHSADERLGETRRAGFTFQTVSGHPLIGEETFLVEKDQKTGAIRVGLSSWSRPGGWLTRLGAPVLRWLQRRASHAALDRLAQMANAPSGK
jgi:hypothetical protein